MIFLLSLTEWTMLGIWILIFILTLVIEIETADLTTIWFCVSSGITAIIAAFGIQPLYQLLFFVGFSFLLILATRPLTKNMMKKEIIHTNSDKFVGMIATVTKEFSKGNVGEVKLKSDLWRAFSNSNESFEIDENVLIEGIEGNKLLVSKLTNESTIEIL